MSKAKKESSQKRLVTDEMNTLCAEIKELVSVRIALGYGTGTGVRKSAESVISRAISAKVDTLSKLVVEVIDA